METNLRLDHDLIAVQTGEDLHVMVELTAPAAAPSQSREPLRLALVLDKSGSMQGHSLAVAKQCAAYLVDQLTGEDELALVAYDSDVSLVASLGAHDKQALHTAIAGIEAGSMTNLSGGWLKGAEELRRADDGIRRVLLLTDGQANEGITDPAQLAGMATNMAAQGTSTTTIGFGAHFDEQLLSAMADGGRGEAHFAETPDDAPGIFHAEFSDLVSLAAQNVSIEVRPTADVEVVGVLNEYPAIPVAGGVQVQVGDAYAGQSLRAVLTLRVPAIATLGVMSVGEVVIRWVSVGAEVKEHAVTHQLVVNAVSAAEAATAVPDPVVTEEVVILTAGQAVREAREAAERGDDERARGLIEHAAERLENVSDAHPAKDQLNRNVAQLRETATHYDLLSPEATKRLHYSHRNLNRRKRDPDA